MSARYLWHPATFVVLFLAWTAEAQVNLNDLTGGCDPTVPIADQCGGRGVCLADNRTCSCNDWWITEADFIESQDCPTSLIAIYVLWSINVAEILYILYTTAYVLVARAENFIEQRKHKRDYTLWKNKGLIAVMIYFILGMPTHLTMAILRLVNPKTRIGFDLFPTVLFFLSKTGLYASSVFLQGPIIAAALRGRPEFKNLVKLNYILNICVSSASITVGSFAFITYDYYQGNLPKQIEIMRAYYFVQAGTLIINGTQAFLVKRWVFSALQTAAALVSSQNNKSETIRRKVESLQNQIMKQGLIQGVIYVVMGAVPFFLNKHAYFLPISWLAMPLIGKRLAFQFDLDKAGAKTLAARLGMKKSSAFDNSATAGSKKKGKEGELSAREITQSENPSFAPGSTYVEDVKAAKQKKRENKKAAQVLSVAISDEEGGMQEIMENGPLRDKFTEFVRKKHASETILLYDACVKYQTVAQGPDSPQQKQEEMNKLGQAIIEAHVKDSSSNPVDMPDDLRKQLLDAAASNTFEPTTLDRARVMAFELLKSNFYQHFAKSLLA